MGNLPGRQPANCDSAWAVQVPGSLSKMISRPKRNALLLLFLASKVSFTCSGTGRDTDPTPSVRCIEPVGWLIKEQVAAATGSLASKPTWLDAQGRPATSAFFCSLWDRRCSNQEGSDGHAQFNQGPAARPGGTGFSAATSGPRGRAHEYACKAEGGRIRSDLAPTANAAQITSNHGNWLHRREKVNHAHVENSNKSLEA